LCRFVHYYSLTVLWHADCRTLLDATEAFDAAYSLDAVWRRYWRIICMQMVLLVLLRMAYLNGVSFIQDLLRCLLCVACNSGLGRRWFYASAPRHCCRWLATVPSV